jgi:hypothetical protein
MSLSVEQIEVVSFETATVEPVVDQPFTPPQANCYSPLCIPTDLPEQCPDKTVATA